MKDEFTIRAKLDDIRAMQMEAMQSIRFTDNLQLPELVAVEHILEWVLGLEG